MPTIPQTETILRSYYETGDRPTQDQFTELIGTMFYLFQTAQAAADSAAAVAAASLFRAPQAMVKAVNAGSIYNRAAGYINVEPIIVTNANTAIEIVRVTWTTPFPDATYKVFVCPYSNINPRRDCVLILDQKSTNVDLRFSQENLGSFGLPDFSLLAFS